MWDCPECGCRNVAASLTTCPACGKERDMPTATTGGASNANALPGETGYVAPEEPAADDSAEVPEVPVAEAADVAAPTRPEPVQAGSAVLPAKAEPVKVPEPVKDAKGA